MLILPCNHKIYCLIIHLEFNQILLVFAMILDVESCKPSLLVVGNQF